MNRAIIIAGVGAAALAGLFIWKRGGIANAAQAVGAGAVEAAGGVASGAVGAIGSAVGLPTPTQTTTSTAEARWLIDNAGHLEASKWAGAPAYAMALFQESGTGTAPAPNSEVGRAFAPLLAGRATDTGDETARLLARYPAPQSFAPESIFSGAGSFGEISGLGLGGYGDVTGFRTYMPPS